MFELHRLCVLPARLPLGFDDTLIEPRACHRVEVVCVPIHVRLQVLHRRTGPVTYVSPREIDETHLARDAGGTTLANEPRAALVGKGVIKGEA